MKEWRRRYTRISCNLPSLLNLPALINFPEGSEHKDGWGAIYDISLGGIKLETRSLVKVGQSLFISFTIAENFTFMNTKGIVRRVSEKGGYYTCGIEFESLTDKQHMQEALKYLVEEQEQHAPPPEQPK